jgi:xylulokinase
VTRWILAVDLGTGGPKVAAVARDGTVLATDFTPVPTQRDGAAATQDPAAWWAGIRAGVHRFLETGAVRGDDLHAVGITGQWASTVPVDAAGAPVGPCLMWSDRRGARHAAAVVGGPVAGFDPRALLDGIRISGGLPLPSGEGLGHELFLRHDQPERYADVAALLEPVDYLGLRFTGRVAATPASMFPQWLIDHRPGRPRAYAPQLLRRYGRDVRRLPPLLPTGSVLGPLTDDVAAELGVRPGVPVACGVPDLHAAYVGSGAVGDGEAHLAVSTTSWISCRTPRKRLDPVRYVATVPAMDDTGYLVVDDQATAGGALRWWVEDVLGRAPGHQEPALRPGYDAILAEARAVPPGARGVLFLPWLHGEHTPVGDPTLRGGFVNVGVGADAAALTRAVLEGVAVNGRWMLEAVERLVGIAFPSLRIIGGGAQSSLWCQIYADVFRRPVEQVEDPMYAQLRGAALIARMAVDGLALRDAATLVPVARRFTPQPGTQRVYDALSAELRTLRGTLRPSVRRLALLG